MKKRIWAMVLCTAVFISGCGVRNNQAERIKALIGKVASESAAEENQKQENEEGNGGEQNEVQGENVNEIFAEGQEESLAGKEEGLDGKEESLAGQENHSVQAEESTNKGMSGEVNEKEEKDKQTEEEIAYRTKYVINCKKSITLRESPSTKAAQLGEILWGEPVSFIQDDKDGFSKVAYQGKTGYVLAAYLGDTPPSLNDNASGMMRVVNCRESISLRRSPSVSASEICQIPLGSMVSYVSSASDGFYEITYMGKNGYALASYLEFYSAQDSVPAASEVRNTGTVRVIFDYFIDNGRECADIIGMDGQNGQVWKYEVRSAHGITELEAVQEIGVIGDAYYFNEDGTIVALAISDGRVLWKNTDFGGASIAFDTDEQGTLYLCGYYGPDLFAIDRNGNTLINVGSFSPDFQWPYELRYENRAVYITFDSSWQGQLVVRYDLNTGGISY